MIKPWTLYPCAALATLGIIAAVAARAQSTSAQSNYIFRFNTGISSVFLSEMTFASEQPLNLGACTATEKINGPLACVVNCDQQSVCLLDLSGPSGSTVADVLEVVSETPVAASSPGPSASGTPPPSSFGTMILGSSAERAALTSRRIEAYNRVGP